MSVIKRYNSKIKEYFSESLLAELTKIFHAKSFIQYPESVYNKFSGYNFRIQSKENGKIKIVLRNNNDKIALVKNFIKLEWGEGINFGTGTNRMGIIKDGLVFKVAIDDAGCVDNLHEYIMAKELQPYVTKVYETNELIAVCEYVKVLNKTDDFNANKTKILDILDELSEITSLMIDVGFVGKNKSNWGLRPDGTPVILDFGYLYTNLDNINLTCMDVDCNKKNGLVDLVYTDLYDTMKCPKCGTKVTTLFLQGLVTQDARRAMYEDRLDESIVVNKGVTYFEIDAFNDMEELDNANDELVTEEKETEELYSLQEAYKKICEVYEAQEIYKGRVPEEIVETRERLRIAVLEAEYGISYIDMDEDLANYDPYKELKTTVNVMKHYRYEEDQNLSLTRELMGTLNVIDEDITKYSEIVNDMTYVADESIFLNEDEAYNALMGYIGEPLREIDDNAEEDEDFLENEFTPGSDLELFASILKESQIKEDSLGNVRTIEEEEDGMEFDLNKFLSKITGVNLNEPNPAIEDIEELPETKPYNYKISEDKESDSIPKTENVEEVLASENWANMFCNVDEEDINANTGEVTGDSIKDGNEEKVEESSNFILEKKTEEVITKTIPECLGKIISVIDSEKENNKTDDKDQNVENTDNDAFINDIKEEIIEKVCEKLNPTEYKNNSLNDKDEEGYIIDSPFAKLANIIKDKDEMNISANDKQDQSDPNVRELKDWLKDQPVKIVYQLKSDGGIVEENKVEETKDELDLEGEYPEIEESNTNVFEETAPDLDETYVDIEDSINKDQPDQESSVNCVQESSETVTEPIQEEIDGSEEDSLQDIKNTFIKNIIEEEYDQGIDCDYLEMQKDYEMNDASSEAFAFTISDEEDLYKFFTPSDIKDDKSVLFTNTPMDIDFKNDLEFRSFPYLYDEELTILGYTREDNNILLFLDIPSLSFNENKKCYYLNNKKLDNEITYDTIEENIMDYDTSILDLVSSEESSDSTTLEDFLSSIDSGDEFEEFEEEHVSLKAQARRYKLK